MDIVKELTDLEEKIRELQFANITQARDFPAEDNNIFVHYERADAYRDSADLVRDLLVRMRAEPVKVITDPDLAGNEAPTAAGEMTLGSCVTGVSYAFSGVQHTGVYTGEEYRRSDGTHVRVLAVPCAFHKKSKISWAWDRRAVLAESVRPPSGDELKDLQRTLAEFGLNAWTALRDLGVAGD